MKNIDSDLAAAKADNPDVERLSLNDHLNPHLDSIIADLYIADVNFNELHVASQRCLQKGRRVFEFVVKDLAVGLRGQQARKRHDDFGRP